MLDLETWCSEHLADGQRRGDEYPARCPWCNELGKFSINLESQFFRCYRSSCESNTVKRWAGYLIAYVEGITIGEARAKLGSATKFEEPTHRKVKLEAQSEKLEIPLPSETILCYAAGRKGSDGSDKEWRVIKYLRERVSNDALKKYGVGWASEGRYYNRAILPVRCNGISSWTARDATDEHETNPKRPKYQNPSGDWANRVFFGWDEANTEGADIVLVEGPFDVMRLSDHGINAIGMLGKELHERQKDLLFSLPRGTVVTVMLDPEVSRLKVDEIVDRIPRRLEVYIAQLPAGVDPGASTPDQARVALDSAIKAR